MAEVAEATMEEVKETGTDNGAHEAADEEAVASADVESAEEGAVLGETSEEADTEEAALAAPAVAEPQAEEVQKIPGVFTFTGSYRNLAVGMAFLLAGSLAFSMNMTNTFFGRWTAWTFVAWGLLLLFSDLLEYFQSFEITEESIIIRNPVRFWYPNKVWTWDKVYRMDLLVKRSDARFEDSVLQVYHEVEGELTKEREDRTFDPTFARLIIERAELQPVSDDNPSNLTSLPPGKATYHWTKSGSLA